MADRTVRAIFEARVSGAQKAMRDLATDVDKAGRKVDDLDKDLKGLDSNDPKVDIDADTSKAQQKIDALGDEGGKAGEDAGEGLSAGIIGALATIPIAGAIVGIGAAIGTALFKGVQDGLAIEAREDRFAAQVGMDTATARRFGRAAGEAYGNAWGNSVEENLDILRMSLQAGIIDESATEAEAQALVEQFAGVVDLFEFDMPAAVTGVANLLKNGLARDAEQAFDLIVSAAQKVPTEDLMDTLTEYSSQWSLAGLTGEQAMGLIVQAMEAGARNTDLVADAVKEMGLRVREGTEPARDALTDLGLDADDVIAKFNAGDPAAMGQVFDALRQLKEDGGNTQEVIANLFGGPGEDLGAALFALDLDTASEALGGLEGSAGSAERALTLMSDNAAAQIESAKRNIEIAADGIKGALAAAFSDEISGAAEWVQRNRGPVMQFLADIVVGIFDFAEASVNGTATAYEAFAGFAASAGIPVLNMLASIAEAIEKALPGDQGGAEFREFADEAILNLQRFNTEAPAVADGMRDTFGGAIDSMRTKFEEWAGPEILKANVHDAVLAATERLDELGQAIDSTEGTITINGESVNAEEALAIMVDNIDDSTGTVTIDGNEVPADRALDALMGAIRTSKGDVTVGANTAAAEAAIEYLARPRTVYLNVRTSGSSLSAINTHEGGWTGRLPGRNAGGWVPGSDPGYDNILWPLYTGGTVLSQPLAGDEFVVNSTDARFWGPLLEWMNAGGRPPAASPGASLDGAVITGTLNIGGDGLARIVDGRIHTASQSQAHALTGMRTA